MVKRISFTVHGRVQGVSFRYFTRKKAISYDITGWVRNTSEGKVAGEAQGQEPMIESFVKDLNEGPSHAQVSKVEHANIDPVEGEAGFHVRH